MMMMILNNQSNFEMFERTIHLSTQSSINNTNIGISPFLTANEKTEYVVITDSEREIAQWVVYTCLCLTIDVLGTVTNILNIICFVLQGFKDPVNVSLLGLAISDLGCLVPLIWGNIFTAPAFVLADPPFDPLEFAYLLSSWPHLAFSRISSWITALITIQRCLCVTAPLQVKTIVTSRRIAIIIMCVFTVCIAGVAPVYAVNGYGLKSYPSRNKSVLGLVFTENREVVDNISFLVNNVLLSFSCFVVIIVCTTILVVKLKMNTHWRTKSTAVLVDNVSSRNDKVAKMVVMISALFIACFIPFVIIFITVLIEPGLAIDGKHRNVGFVLGGICLLTESVNSSMNIFIYYHMSSKFRATFRKLFLPKIELPQSIYVTT